MTQCNQDTQIAINDTQFGNRLICRDFEYYVNPDSDSIIELGTMDYPYKDISYVFIELLNYHSYTDRNLTVNLMEGTTNIIGNKQGYILNITNVEIITYSFNSSESGKAKILIIDEVNITTKPSTLFNVMKTFELRINDQVSTNNAITEEQRLRIEFSDYNIMIFTSNFKMENFDVISEREDINEDVNFIFSVDIQEKAITLKDMHFNVSGTITMTYDPLNMNLINIDVDYYRNLGGFEQIMFCNYPEAVIDTTIYADNFKIYYGSDREIYVNKQALRNQQPGTFIVNNYHSEIYTEPNEPYGVLTVYLTNE